MAIVEVLGQKAFSNSKKGSTGDFYDETFYFYFKDLKKEQIAEANLKITIMDKAYMLGFALPKKFGAFDGRIGVYQVDLLQIYNSKDHELYRRWGTLRDPYNEDDPGPRGLVKFSCAVLGPGDKQRPHDPSREPNDDDDAEADVEKTEGAAVVDPGSHLPGGSGATLQFLVIGILRVDGLPGFDRILSTIKTGLYVYCQCEFAGCKPVKTTRVAVMGRKNLSVTFEEEIWIPVWVPTLSRRAAVTVMNSELGRSDQVVATAYIDFSDVPKYDKDPVSSGSNPFAMLGMMKKSYNGSSLKYLHFYGANPQVRGGPKAARFMNKFPNYGSAYRGSMLCSMRVVKKHSGIEQPHKKPMSYEIPPHLLPQYNKYIIKMMIYQGSDFGNKGFGASGKSGKYALGLSIGTHEMRSTFKPYDNGSVEWVELLDAEIMLPAEVKHLPETFITLYRGSESSYQSVAYIRLSTLKIVSKKTEPDAQWLELQHDQSHKSNPLIQGYPGSVLLRLAIVNLEDVTKPMEWESERIKMNIKEPYLLRVFVYQCRGLPPINDNGLIDPYVKVRFSGNKQKSTTKKMTQAPVFFEVLEFNHMLVKDKKLAPNIVLQVWDSKFGGKTPVGIVRCPLDGVQITNAANAANAGIPTPKWMKLRGIDGKGNMGEILASFMLLRKETLDKRVTPSREITPSLRKCYIDIHVVGLRNLTRLGSASLRMPFLEFDVVSHAYGDRVQGSTCRLPAPTDPNYLDRFVVLTYLPDDPLYCPSLELRVYDQRRTGKQLVAVTNIDLFNKLPWNGSEYVPPRQHSIMSDTFKARKEIAEMHAKSAKSKKRGGTGGGGGDDAGDEEPERLEVKVVDEGFGLFPPEPGAQEPGAKYLELPIIIDQQEYDEARNKMLAEIAAEDAALPMDTAGGMNAAIRKMLKIPSAWSKTNFMAKRDWWIDSKKENEGGALEAYLKTYAFENYPLFRGHIAFNKFGKRKDTTTECGILKAVIRVCPKNPRNDEEYNNFNRSIRKVEKCIVRVYVIKAANLQPLDWMGTSDPFLKVSLGTKEYKSKSMTWNLNPEFFETYQVNFIVAIPDLLDQWSFTRSLTITNSTPLSSLKRACPVRRSCACSCGTRI